MAKPPPTFEVGQCLRLRRSVTSAPQYHYLQVTCVQAYVIIGVDFLTLERRAFRRKLHRWYACDPGNPKQGVGDFIDYDEVVVLSKKEVFALMDAQEQRHKREIEEARMRYKKFRRAAAQLRASL